MTREAIETKLDHLGIPARVVETVSGGAVTTYLVETDPSVAASKLMGASRDLQLVLGVTSLEILVPYPGTNLVGIQVPSDERSNVNYSDRLDLPGPLGVAIGMDTRGYLVSARLVDMPHLLIGGTTGSGKSVCVNAVICSLLDHYDQEALNLVLMDFKQVELAPYADIPHLLFPIITIPQRAIQALNWLVAEMERRFTLLLSEGVRNIQEYHDLGLWLPYIVVVIDEMADLMLQAGERAEMPIVRLTQKARAVGIHLVLATQRPTTNIVTGLIKANIPSRIAFAVASQVDSRVILDVPGAEMLTGRGDMLFLPAGGQMTRLQGVYVPDDEVRRLTA